MRDRYGKASRESDDPVETFFNSVDDAEVMAQERMDLLGTERRRFGIGARGLDEAVNLDFLTGTIPVADFTDTEKDADMPAIAGEFGMDFAKQQCRFTLFG